MPEFSEEIERQAVRILFIMRYCGDSQLSLFGPRFTIDSEIKLQKLQFWVRNPDYLADSLLDLCHPESKLLHRKQEIKKIVYKIFQDREPIIRSAPMQRLHYGAYEPLDKVLLLLIGIGVMRSRRQSANHRQTLYFLTEKGEQFIETMRQECDETLWYVERCRLIHSFWGNLKGSQMGDIQHSNPIYHDTKISEILPPIILQVRQKYFDYFGEVLPDYES